MSFKALFALLLAAALPFCALADAPEPLQLSTKAQVEGESVPLDVTVSAQSEGVTLSPTKTDGAVPVTFTLYIAAKPKPQPEPAPDPNAAAVVGSSASIQQGIGSISPTAEQYAHPVFSTIDSARSSAADVLDHQLTSTKARIAPDSPGEVLGAEAVKNSGSHPMGTVMYILYTLYFYLLTLLRFIVGSAGVFYPLLAVAFLYMLLRGFRLVRRPRY
jgi:hypothetical protein